jgi:predicted GIY-YIG superfamily endonuclease
MKIYIYKIYNDDMAYIGSTVNFKKRMDCHKSNCNNENLKAYNCFIYQYIRQHGGWDEFTKEIIHTCEVVDKTEQRMVEQEWIKNNQCKLNDRRSYITEEELKEYNKDYYKKYHETHKEKRNHQKKQKTTCECGVIYTKTNKARHERSKKHIQFMKTNK